MTRNIGAICGDLSHFGASAADTNGIPAITLSEPDHVTYAVFYKDKWRPYNFLNHKRFPHWDFWRDNSEEQTRKKRPRWSALTTYTATYTAMYQTGARTRNAQLIATLAKVQCSDANNRNGVTRAMKLYNFQSTCSHSIMAYGTAS